MQRTLGSTLDYTQHSDLFNKFIKAIPDDVTIVPAHLPEILEAFELGMQHAATTSYDVNAKLAEYKSRVYLELEKSQDTLQIDSLTTRADVLSYIKDIIGKAYSETII